MRSAHYRYTNIAVQAIVLALLAFYVYPLYMLFTFSFKTLIEMMNEPFALPSSFHLTNYVEAWRMSNFGTALLNSVILTVVPVVAVLLIGSMASYPLARRNARLATFVYVLFLCGLMIPGQLNIVPLFQLIHDLGLLRTRTGAILIYIAGGLPITVFFYTGFIRSVPKELEESAAIDGSSNVRTFFSIVFPLLLPVTATVFILQFLRVWNDFFIPIIFLNTSKLKTVQVAIYTFMGQYSNNDWVHMFPMLVLGILPVLALYLFFQKYIVAGIMGGSLKG